MGGYKKIKKRIVKDSAFWYKETIETNGGHLMINQKQEQPVFLEPVMKQMVWGGNRLHEIFGYTIPGDDTGECWAISAHPNGDCVIKNGVHQGERLSELWEQNRDFFGGITGDRFPLLAKIIDARDDLSIQVHPDDSYALVNENGSYGKTECWYILDAPVGAKLIIGHSAGSKEELAELISEEKWDTLLTSIEVKKGDFIQIDPGTVHAITAGILILEIQQNSDITYRLYDYDRLSDGIKRPLHIDKSLDVIHVPATDPETMVRHCADLEPDRMHLLVESAYYKVWKCNIVHGMEIKAEEPFYIVNVVEGDGLFNSEPIKKGDHFIIPENYGMIKFIGKMELVLSTVSDKK